MEYSGIASISRGLQVISFDILAIRSFHAFMAHSQRKLCCIFCFMSSLKLRSIYIVYYVFDSQTLSCTHTRILYSSPVCLCFYVN